MKSFLSKLLGLICCLTIGLTILPTATVNAEYKSQYLGRFILDSYAGKWNEIQWGTNFTLDRNIDISGWDDAFNEDATIYVKKGQTYTFQIGDVGKDLHKYNYDLSFNIRKSTSETYEISRYIRYNKYSSEQQYTEITWTPDDDYALTFCATFSEIGYGEEVDYFLASVVILADKVVNFTNATLTSSDSDDTLWYNGNDADKQLELAINRTPNNANWTKVEWSSSNESVATVNPRSHTSLEAPVTAVGAGNATITAKLYGPFGDLYKELTYNLTVKGYVNGISLNKDTLELYSTSSETLTATVNPGNAYNTGVTWNSSDTKVATVDQNGKVTAVGAGEATITATSDGKDKDGNKASATCRVVVSNLASFKVWTSTDKMTWGPDGVAWGTKISQPADTDIKEGSYGDRLYVKSGSKQTIILAGVIHGTPGVHDGETYKLNLTIKDKNSKEEILKKETVYNKDSDGQCSIEWIPESNYYLTFETFYSNNYGTEESSKYQQIDVTIYAEEDTSTTYVNDIDLKEDNVTLYTNCKDGENTATLHATINPDNATVGGITWKSEDPTIATVDENGKVTAVGYGTTTIVAESVGTKEDGTYASTTCTVNVQAHPENIVIVPSQNNDTGEVGVVYYNATQDSDKAVKLSLHSSPLNAQYTKVEWSITKGSDLVTLNVDSQDHTTADLRVKDGLTTVSDDEVIVKAVAYYEENGKTVTKETDYPIYVEALVEGITTYVDGKKENVVRVYSNAKDAEKNQATIAAVINPSDVYDDSLQSTYYTNGFKGNDLVYLTTTGSKEATITGKTGGAGVITALANGINKDHNQAAVEWKVYVTELVEGVTLNKSHSVIFEGNDDTLIANVKNQTASSVKEKSVTYTYKSSNPSVATVDSNGKITALEEGTTAITVTASDYYDEDGSIGGYDRTATCVVTVVEAEQYEAYLDAYIDGVTDEIESSKKDDDGNNTNNLIDDAITDVKDVSNTEKSFEEKIDAIDKVQDEFDAVLSSYRELDNAISYIDEIGTVTYSDASKQKIDNATRIYEDFCKLDVTVNGQTVKLVDYISENDAEANKNLTDAYNRLVSAKEEYERLKNEAGKSYDPKDTNHDGIVTCDEEMNSKNWIWSETKKACVYKISNTNTK